MSSTTEEASSLLKRKLGVDLLTRMVSSMNLMKLAGRQQEIAADHELQLHKMQFPTSTLTGDEDMGDTNVAGDQQTTHTTNITNTESPLAKMALAAGLLAAGAGLPMTAWILKDILAPQIQPTPEVGTPVTSTTTINQGLDTDTTIQLSLPEWKE